MLPIDALHPGESEGPADCVRDVLWEPDPLTDGLLMRDELKAPVIEGGLLVVKDPLLERTEVIV